MVQVMVPEGAVPGGQCAFVMPSGTTVQITVPPGAGPGTVLEVADPGYVGTASPMAPPAYGVQPPPPPAGQVIGIQATGAHSAISGVTAVGPQTMPYGYDLLGDKYGVVAKTLLPGEVFHSEPGAMVFMSDGVAMSAKFGGGFRGTASQVFSGESFAKVEYTNRAGAPGYIGLTSNQPFSSVIPVQLAALPGGSINVKRGAYMAGTPDVTARMKYLPAKDCTACCCGGMPPLIQEVSGAPNGGWTSSSRGGGARTRPPFVRYRVPHGRGHDRRQAAPGRRGDRRRLERDRRLRELGRL